MTVELTLLALSTAFAVVHIVLASHSASFARGYRWTASARDQPLPELTGIPGRLARASANYQETFPLFAAGILLVTVTNHQSDLTMWAAIIYLVSRVLYLIAYASGVYLVRSLIWNFATAAILVLLAACFI